MELPLQKQYRRPMLSLVWTASALNSGLASGQEPDIVLISEGEAALARELLCKGLLGSLHEDDSSYKLQSRPWAPSMNPYVRAQN